MSVPLILNEKITGTALKPTKTSYTRDIYLVSCMARDDLFLGCFNQFVLLRSVAFQFQVKSVKLKGKTQNSVF